MRPRVALPLVGLDAAKEGERFLAPLAEGGERTRDVVAQVLPLVRPAIGIDTDELGLVHRHDDLQARHERLLGVAQVADHFLGRPVLGVRPPRHRRVVLATDGGREVVGGARRPRAPLVGRLLRVLLHRRHQGLPSRARVS
jgi:hypothetical protein